MTKEFNQFWSKYPKKKAKLDALKAWDQMNKKAAERLNIRDEDEFWIESPYTKVKGRVKLRQGIRPDCLLTTQQYGQWATPVAKELKIPNLNQVAPSLVELTDETGGSKDHVKVKVYKARGKQNDQMGNGHRFEKVCRLPYLHRCL